MLLALFFLLSLFSPNLFAGEAVVNPRIVNLTATASGLDIQAALDGLPVDGEVVLAAGKYEVHQPIILRHDHQVLRGAGLDTVLFLADGANCPVIVLGAPAVAPMRQTSHLRLADLLIDGNREHQSGEFWKTAVDGAVLNNNGIDVWDVSDAAVERVVCRACRSGGLVTASGTRRLTVRDFTAFDNQFDGLACYLTEDSHFSRLYLHDNHCAGISLDLSFNHNSIEDSVLSGNDLGVFMRNSRDNSFQGLTILKSRHDGVFIAQTPVQVAGGWQLSPESACVGNKFADLQVSNCGGKDVWIHDAGCTNNVVSVVPFTGKTRDDLFAFNLPKLEPKPVLNLAASH
jgi:parallel beta-helix repeat protein